MVEPNLLGMLREKNKGEIDQDLINEEIIQNPETVNDIISGLSSENENLQTNCAGILTMLSSVKPSALYPFVDIFIINLTDDQVEHRFHATEIIGNLAAVDESKKIADQIPAIARNLSGDNEQVQQSSVMALGKIASANAGSAERIFNLLISHTKYFPGEKITIVLESLKYFSENTELREDARRFIERYIKSSSEPVKVKAMNVLKDL
jgi:HEAT repeat protein